MKISEIINEQLLLELREVLDRQYYGAWIHADTKKIQYIDKMQHVQTMQVKLIDDYGLPPNEVRSANRDKIYSLGFATNHVRIVFAGWESIQIEGVKDDIVKISQMLLASCLQSNVDTVWVDRHDTPESPSHGNKGFDMPVDRRNLMMFLKGEV